MRPTGERGRPHARPVGPYIDPVVDLYAALVDHQLRTEGDARGRFTGKIPGRPRSAAATFDIPGTPCWVVRYITT